MVHPFRSGVERYGPNQRQENNTITHFYGAQNVPDLILMRVGQKYNDNFNTCGIKSTSA
jgi:cbb3-type cytochrome oxidase cytochrome c subunit